MLAEDRNCRCCARRQVGEAVTASEYGASTIAAMRERGNVRMTADRADIPLVLLAALLSSANTDGYVDGVTWANEQLDKSGVGKWLQND